MKRTKKLLSLITVFCILAALFSAMTVSADSAGDNMPDAPAGVFYNVNNADGYTTDDYSITYSDEAKEGHYSLNINNINEVANRSLITKVPFRTTLATGDTYKVSFWIKTTNREGQYALGNSTQDVKISGLTPSAANEWVFCEAEHTLTIDATNFQFTTWKHQRYIDDLQVRKVNGDGTYGENVVLNGNFEAIKVYTQNTQTPAQWHSWYSGSKASTMYTQNTFFASTDADAHSGNRSMLVNVQQELDNTTFDVLTYLEKGLTNGTNYRLEMYVKNVEDTTRATFGNNGGHIKWGAIYTGGGTLDKDGWYKVAVDFAGDAAQDKTIRFLFWPQGTMLLDDISLYELDADSNPTGENLIANGDMESYLDFAAVPTDGYSNSNWDVTRVVGQLPDSTASWTDYRRFEEVAPGNYAMHLKYADYVKDNTYTYISMHSQIALTNGTNYTIEYDIKGSTNGSNAISWHLLGDWGALNLSVPGLFRNVEATDLGNGWRHCKVSGTSNKDVSKLGMIVQARADILLDNIVMYETADTSKTNLVIDGDFQKTVKLNVTDFTNVVAYPVRAGGAATVSWTNAHGTIENAAVSVNGVAQDVEINLTQDAYNEIYLADLTPGETYEISVSATINGTEKTYTSTIVALEISTNTEEMDFRTAGLGDFESDDWSSYIRDGEGYANTNISVENGAAKINGNIPEVKGNTYVGIEQTVELDRGKLYQLTFKAKGENVQTFRAIEDVTLEDGSDFWVVNGFTLGSDWTEYSVILDATNASDVSLYDVFAEGELYNARILLMTEQYKGTVWIDDVAVCEIDPDTYEVIGENLIVNGGFDAPVAVYGEPVLTLNGEAVSKLSAGNINVSVTLENTDSIALLTALYKDGTLVSVAAMEKASVDSEAYETNITVPDEEGNFTAKVMYWTSIGSMQPVRAAAEITE